MQQYSMLDNKIRIRVKKRNHNEKKNNNLKHNLIHNRHKNQCAGISNAVNEIYSVQTGMKLKNTKLRTVF
jgi:hypothetical protein